jgi:hypothetical protein
VGTLVAVKAKVGSSVDVGSMVGSGGIVGVLVGKGAVVFVAAITGTAVSATLVGCGVAWAQADNRLIERHANNRAHLNPRN